MELRQLLGVGPGITALIGSGGKTTAMYRLAGELQQSGTVICTTTTHIFPPEHLPVLEDPSGNAIAAALAVTPCVCVGRPRAEGKLGPGTLSPAALAELADYVLVEADGSRGRPCKAHLDYEPVIPVGTRRTVLVVGAAGFGQPIREAVHRVERFCALAGSSPDERVTMALLSRVIRGEALGDVVLVNQVETAEALACARELAAQLEQSVVAGSLHGGEWLCVS